ncbi:MAG: 6-pyruvoyl-tetrahydropterin synthase-related protein [Anaerolineae bacterium]
MGRQWRVSRSVVYVLVAILLVIPAAWPLLQPGFIATRGGGDSPFLLIRLQQMLAGLQVSFPVRWMPDANYGLGYPFWNFYAPLPYYFAALLTRLGLGPIAAIKTAQALGLAVAAVGIFALARRMWDSAAAGLLAAAAYTYAPFHLVNIYVRGDSLGEFWAFAFYPLTWVAARAAVARPTPARLAALALAYAGLVLSHNISALIFSPFLALYILAVWWQNSSSSREEQFPGVSEAKLPKDAEASRSKGMGSRHLARHDILALAFPLLALAVGLALSAWFWWPALADRALVHLEVNLTGFFSYTGHFRGANLVQLGPAFDYDPAGGAAFALGLAQAAAIALGLIVALTWRRGRQPEGLATAATLLVSLFFVTPLSQPLWDHLPLLPFAQFPWRFLSVVAFAGALLLAAIAARVGERNPRAGWIAAGVLAVVLAVAGLARLDPPRIPLVDSEVTAQRSAWYEIFSGNIGTTIRGEYLPTTVDPRPYIAPAQMTPDGVPQAVIVSGAARAAQQPDGGWQVTVDSPDAVVAFPTIAFPGWQVWLDGAHVEGNAESGTGYISARIPQGTHNVALRFAHTGAALAAEIAALLALILLATLLVVDRRWLRYAVAGVIVALVILLVGTGFQAQSILAARQVAADSPLVEDFLRYPWLHRAPDGVRYASGSRLTSYTVSGRKGDYVTIKPGETLEAQLKWSEFDTGQVDVVLESPAEHLQDISYQIANQRVRLAPTTVHRLTIPSETTPGLYWLRLRVQNASGDEVPPLDAQDEAMGRLYLLPVYVLPSEAPAPPPAPRYPMGDDVSLADVRWEQRGRRLFVDLTWLTERSLAQNYVTSIRLLGAEGKQIVGVDQPPGYGFFPTISWQPGQPVYDRRQLNLPESLPPGEYQLEVILYEKPTLREIGRTLVGGVKLGG